MPRTTILTDELVKALVAVGQVDVLVGAPTFNNGGTIGRVVTAIHTGLAHHFPRERTVLICPDGGSDDGTLELARAAPVAAEERLASASLRTTHRIVAPYAGRPGRAAGMRAVFAAADLLGARTVLLVDPAIDGFDPTWTAALARPVAQGEADLVLPIHPRERFSGALVTQLVRPLLGTAYARRLTAGLSGAFGCSGRLATRMAVHPLWEGDVTRAALEVWMVATALSDDLQLLQVHLGACRFAARPAPARLPDLFEQVVGAAFASLERDADVWIARGAAVDLPVRGEPHAAGGPRAAVDSGPLAERFRNGVRELSPLLRDIVEAKTFERLQAAAAGGNGPPAIPDPLWVTVVYEFAAAAHHGIMTREHLTGAMVPLYLGRIASFFDEVAHGDEDAHRERLAALEREYEVQRPRLIERWTNRDGR